MKVINNNFLKFLIVIIAFQDVAAGVAGSIMADIIAAFPDYNPTIVMLVATFPGLMQIVPALLYGKLSARFTKRALLFTGLILFMIGGVMPFFLENLPLIILFRGILGLGVGITMPLSIDIITGFFDGRERDFLIGFGTSTIACIGAIFFQVGGGILADSFGWQYGFLSYLFPIWILALTFLFLPEPKKAEVPNAKLSETLLKAPKTVYGFSIGQILFSALIFGYVTNISIVITSEQLGSATEAGLAISVFTTGTLLIGFFFGRIRSISPTYCVPIAVLLTGIGMMFCYYATSLTTIFLASLVAGVGMGIGIPGIFARITEMSDPKRGISFVGFVVAAQGFGGIIGPFIFQAIMQVFNQEVGRFPLLISAVGLLILGLMWAIIATLSKQRTTEVHPHVSVE